MFKCKVCWKELKTSKGLSVHITKEHSGQKDYYDKYINPNAQKTCSICGRPLKFINLEHGYSLNCSHQDAVECKICGRKFSKNGPLEFHIQKGHSVKVKDYYDQFLKKPEEGYCLYCRKETKFENLVHGYSMYCHNGYCKCMHKYGVDNPAKSEIVKKKAKETAMKNHGGLGLASPEIKKRVQQTNIKKYGVKSPFEAESVKDKIKQTNLERYSAENVFASEYGKQKIRETNLEKFGTESAMQSEEVKQRLKDNITKRYGGIGGASKTILEKMKKTNLERYGSENIRSSEEGKRRIKESLEQKIQAFEKKNNCTRLVDFQLLYPYKVLQCLDIPSFVYKARTFIKNEYIDLKKFKELDEKFTSEAKEYNSRYESEIHTWLNSIYFDDIQVNTFGIIEDDTKKQLDFYIPKKNLAIEFNGDYWHSTNAGKDKNYHLNKTQLCQDQDIRLIHIFEHEWNLKKDVCKSIISSALGIYENRIYARECEVKEVNSKEARQFLDENHLQSFVASSYRLGLYYNDELVQLLCFGQNRFKKNEVELLRMCTKLNTQVIGGFSKLLKHQPYASFVSYVDLSKFDANSYLENNFKLINQSSPNYKYISGEQILNRISAQKHKLKDLLGSKFDECKTESQNMIDAGYWQVYDCGNLKLEYTSRNI